MRSSHGSHASGGRSQSHDGTIGRRPAIDTLSAIEGERSGNVSTGHLSMLDVLLAEFTNRWDRGESPRLEDYLERLPRESRRDRVELIFREFCLAGWAGLNPCPEEYQARFPEHAEALERLFQVDDVLGSAGLQLWEEASEPIALPEVGHEVGPYRLIRELGRGAFARVFLAEQANLDDRLVVVKVSNRITSEPALLARAGHPHIAEVLWHGDADDGALQLICMPFLGGASLSAVLGLRDGGGPRPGSGRDLLSDLDRVSADGYLPPRSGRPARELLARLSYPRATAWVVARLAEALDYAYARGVLHGDVKPSNVLLTADGMPMLLDFNLSVGYRPSVGPRASAGDSGGTLAYMAPERLRTVAEPGKSPRSTTSDRHRADIYSLGVLLLEMLTGAPPEPPKNGALSPREVAEFYVSTREHDSEVILRSVGTPLPAGLKSVLARCLAPDPADRYSRASELAEDLDLWRSDRALAFAHEPGFVSGLLRRGRRRKGALIALAAGILITAVTTAVAWRQADRLHQLRAIQNYTQIIDGEEGVAFQVRRPGLGLVKPQGTPAETARRRLDRYGVLEAGGQWREREDFRSLSPADRNDLEAWLLEQTLRFAHALGDRPESPADWNRALLSLEQETIAAPYEALLAECRKLREQLGQPADPSAKRSSTPTVALQPWMTNYLNGVGAELREDGVDALSQYRAALFKRPRSFWANYRAAAVSFAAKDYHEAARRLEVCVVQRPENPVLRRQLAGCLYWDHRYQEAVTQCDRAQALDPDHAETYVTRSFLRIELGQFQEFVKDLNLYDALMGRRRRASSERPRLDIAQSFGGLSREVDRPDSLPNQGPLLDPGEAVVRNELAHRLLKAGQHEIALDQYDRLLKLNPDDLLARFNSAAEHVNLRQGDGEREFALIVQDPRIESLVRDRPEAISAFRWAVPFLMRQGKLLDALYAARTNVRLADRYEIQQAQSYYQLAMATAVSSKNDPSMMRSAVDSLSRAYQVALEDTDQRLSRSIRAWYLGEPAFEGIRAEYGLVPFVAR